ncbi:MAG: hypothetical protein JO187_04445 [Acidobacteria bacterium]|nr:hypothetical protein [Acidobacteriota bacterium]
MASGYIYSTNPVTALVVGMLGVLLLQLIVLIVLAAVTARRSHHMRRLANRRFPHLTHPVH